MDRPERPALVPIGRFAKLAGLSVPQLRHYDRRGLLLPVVRDDRSGYRYYSGAQAQAARFIALLRSIDVPLADIQELLAAPEPDRVRRVFAEHRRRVEQRLDEARATLESIDRLIAEGEPVGHDDDRCSFCGQPAAGRPAALASERATICATCVGLARDVLAEHAGQPRRTGDQAPAEAQRPGWLACAFCGRAAADVTRLVGGPDVAICDDCVAAVPA